MKEPYWVLPEIVTSVHKMLLSEHGGAPGIRDNALLDSALNRPRQLYSYDSNASIFDLAAAYCYGLSRNHSFIDGNKRIALTIAALFLEINGYSLNASEPEAVLIIQKLAAGHMPEKDLSDWFKTSSLPHA